MEARDISLAYHLTCTVYENNNVVKQYELVDGVETNVIEFVYDSNGSPIYMEYNGVIYYYEENLQGDIVAILDANGNTVVEYSYDIWGKLLGITGELADTLGVVNPLRYRGYYYDTETNLYYLQSRYYSPDLMRFISQDDAVLSNDQGQPLGSNLYAYCLNDPTNMIDLDGHASSQTYSGIVGFGIQIVVSASVLYYQGFVGFEAIWFNKKNNFGNGFIPWCYWYYGGSLGFTLDFNKLLSPNLLKNPKNVLKGFGLSFSCSVSITCFLVTANKMRDPYDYIGGFSFWTGTVYGVTISKAWSSRISTYGVGVTWEVGIKKWSFSFGKKLFGTSRGYSYYRMIRIGTNAKSLYNSVKGRV